jgi:hypothetical protein
MLGNKCRGAVLGVDKIRSSVEFQTTEKKLGQSQAATRLPSSEFQNNIRSASVWLRWVKLFAFTVLIYRVTDPQVRFSIDGLIFGSTGNDKKYENAKKLNRDTTSNTNQRANVDTTYYILYLLIKSFKTTISGQIRSV